MRIVARESLVALALIMLMRPAGPAEGAPADPVPAVPLSDEAVRWCASSASALHPYVRRWSLPDSERPRLEGDLQAVMLQGIHLLAARESAQVPPTAAALKRVRATVNYHAKRLQWEYAAPDDGLLDIYARATQNSAKEYRSPGFQPCLQLKDLRLAPNGG